MSIDLDMVERFAQHEIDRHRGNPLAKPVLALVTIARAAERFTDLPIPNTFDERVEWMTSKQQTIDALALLAAPANEETR